MLRDTLRRLTHGIQLRLFLWFVAVALVPIASLGVLTSRLIESTLVRETEYYLGKVCTQLVNHLDVFVDEMRNTLMTVALSDDLPVFLEEGSYSARQRYESFSRINGMMLSAVSNRSYNDLLLLVRDRRYILSTYAKGTTGDLDAQSFDEDAFLATMRESPNTLRIVGPDAVPTTGDRRYGFALALDARAVITGLPPERCFLIITATRAFFDDLVRDVADGVVDILLITDVAGEVVQASTEIAGSAVVPDRYSRAVLGGRSYLMRAVPSRSTGWTVSFLASDERIRAGRDRLAATVAIFLAAAASLVLVLSWTVARRITEPICRLGRLMGRVETDDLSVRAPPGGNDEIGDLSRSFNAMVGRMDRMVNELVRSRILTREAELVALQQQVNPHFLYNTLESISSLAGQQRWEEIRTVVRLLAGIFRYAISRAVHESVRFADELAHVRDYLALQQVRFGGRFTASFEVDERIPPLLSMKFVLQPLVENALRHGLGDRTEGGRVAIRGRLEGDEVVLDVEDNGAGIPPDQLAELRRSLAEAVEQPLKAGSCVGLRNVHSRIRLEYGDHFGVSLQTLSAGGTRATVRLPRREAPPG